MKVHTVTTYKFKWFTYSYPYDLLRELAAWFLAEHPFIESVSQTSPGHLQVWYRDEQRPQPPRLRAEVFMVTWPPQAEAKVNRLLQDTDIARPPWSVGISPAEILVIYEATA